MIHPKDRGMICRMAANVASGLVADFNLDVEAQRQEMAEQALDIALRIIAGVDERLVKPKPVQMPVPGVHPA